MRPPSPSPAAVCRCCGKALTDPVSVDLGVGPVCRITSKTRQSQERTENLFAHRASYTHDVVQGVVCITDLDGPKSVTNDAENVVADLVRAGVILPTTPVIYRDTMGVWDELVVTGGRFVGFRPVTERDQAAAVAKIRARAA